MTGTKKRQRVTMFQNILRWDHPRLGRADIQVGISLGIIVITVIISGAPDAAIYFLLGLAALVVILLIVRLFK